MSTLLLKEDSDGLLKEDGDNILHEGVLCLSAVLSGAGTLTADFTTYYILMRVEQLKPVYHGLVEIVLSAEGEDTLTYTSEDRILDITNIESNNSYKATVTLSNHDNTFSALDLTGYTAVVSWGCKLHLDSGDVDAYIPVAPLKVIHQQNTSAQDVLQTTLVCISVVDRMSEQLAETTSGALETDTLKDIIDVLLTPGYGFDDYEAVTASWDSEDDLIDDFVYGPYFRVRKGASRLSKINALLGYSKEVKVLRHDGELHFINPTISGTTYDYEYELLGDHTFLGKSAAFTPVVPNHFEINGDDYWNPKGDAKDDASWAIRPVYALVVLQTEDGDEADAIATALLQRATLNSQYLNMEVPMNMFQEVWDYVKITDSREGGTTKTGNVQYIERSWNYRKGEFNMRIKFGGPSEVPGASLGKVKDEVDAYRAQRVAMTAGGLFELLEPLLDEMVDAINALETRLKQEELTEDYEAGDLDSEAEIIAAINATNAKINDIIQQNEEK